MNSDDIVSKHRFEQQVDSLNNSEVSLTNLSRINSKGRQANSFLGKLNSPYYHPIFLLFGAYGANATLAAKSDWWLKNSFFDSLPALDWRIALRAYPDSKISYLPYIHYKYRKHEKQISLVDSNSQDLASVYTDWKSYCLRLDLNYISYENFIAAAAPWQFNSKISLLQFRSWAHGIKKLVSDLPEPIGFQVSKLIERRLLINLFNNSVPPHRKVIELSQNLRGAMSCLTDLLLK